MTSAILNRRKFSKLFEILRACIIKVLLLIGFIFFLVHVLYDHLYFNQCHEEDPIIRVSSPAAADLVAPTNISHIVFAISGSAKGWRHRGPYIDLWWRPNQTRGLVWLDKDLTNSPWPSTSPPLRVSADTARFKAYDRHANRFTVRMARMILETFEEGFEGVRWFVKADDDTVLFVDNLVEVLTKYDHNGYYYIGGNSECIGQNDQHSFNMGFGGAGFAVSCPLAKALAKNLDGCLKRYPALYGEDHLIQSCIAELGVSFTREPGFHQIDLHGDISGFLSAHPQTPVLSLHHIDVVEPIFPSMSRYDALCHLMRAAVVDSSRLLQQIICYDHEKRWSVSISWGYSVHIYEELHPPGFLQIPLQTFWAWNRRARPPFMFNIRPRSYDPCLMPHVFYLDVEVKQSNQIVTDYIRRTPWKLSSCGNHSVESISRIKVSTPIKRLQWDGTRRECGEIKPLPSLNATEITVRACGEDEAQIWSHIS